TTRLQRVARDQRVEGPSLYPYGTALRDLAEQQHAVPLHPRAPCVEGVFRCGWPDDHAARAGIGDPRAQRAEIIDQPKEQRLLIAQRAVWLNAAATAYAARLQLVAAARCLEHEGRRALARVPAAPGEARRREELASVRAEDPHAGGLVADHDQIAVR